MMLTYAVPIFCSTRTGETRITATMVPITSAPMAEKNARYIVMPKAATMSYLPQEVTHRARPFGVGAGAGVCRAARLSDAAYRPRCRFRSRGPASAGWPRCRP